MRRPGNSKLDTLMLKVTSEIVVHAAPERVWRVLTDFTRLRDWHPFVEIEGPAEQGAKVGYYFRLDPSGPRRWDAKALIKHFEHPRTLLFALGIPGILRIEERYELAAVPGGTRVTHGAEFRGIIPFFLPRGLIRRRALPICQRPIEWLAQYLAGQTVRKNRAERRRGRVRQ